MELTIVIVGLLILLSGVFLAWHQKGSGVWATFAFGFFLVLVGGPVSSRLGTLSVSGTGVEVAFNATTISQAEQGALAERAGSVLLSLAPSEKDDNSPERVLLGNASKAFQRDLFNYIVSIGFVPIQPTGAELIQPGTILRLEEGRPIVWASASEAFPSLQSVQSSVAIPLLDQRSVSESQQVDVSFRCAKGSRVSEASLFALSTSVRSEVANAAFKARDLRVVQSVLTCSDFQLAARIKSSAGVDEDSINYGEESKVVLGVKLATVDHRPL